MEHLLNGSHKEILSNLVQYVNENMKASRNDLERQKNVNTCLKWIIIFRNDKDLDRCLAKIKLNTEINILNLRTK